MKSANVFLKPFYVTYFEISQNWLEIMWFKGCSYGLSLICPWQLNWYWKWQHLSFFVLFIKSLYPLLQRGISSPLVSPMIHTWYFSHQLQTQFVWASLVSPDGPFLHGCPTKKAGQGYFIYVPCFPGSMHTIFKSPQIFKLCSEYFNFSSTCFMLSWDSFIWTEWPMGMEANMFPLSVEHTSNFFWSYQWKVSIWLAHTHNP